MPENWTSSSSTSSQLSLAKESRSSRHVTAVLNYRFYQLTLIAMELCDYIIAWRRVNPQITDSEPLAFGLCPLVNTKPKVSAVPKIKGQRPKAHYLCSCGLPLLGCYWLHSNVSQKIHRSCECLSCSAVKLRLRLSQSCGEEHACFLCFAGTLSSLGRSVMFIDRERKKPGTPLGVRFSRHSPRGKACPWFDRSI